jgi:hypothetical protein
VDVRAALPAGPSGCPARAWPQNAIDVFILARLEAAGLAPSRPADPLTWLRRATFDLTSLAPTQAEEDAKKLAPDTRSRYQELERPLARFKPPVPPARRKGLHGD